MKTSVHSIYNGNRKSARPIYICSTHTNEKQKTVHRYLEMEAS